MSAQASVGQTNLIAVAMDEINDAPASLNLVRGNSAEAMLSVNGKSGQSEAATLRCSHAGCACADRMHELANSVTVVLINAQLLEWRLPPYSRLKRIVREIQRRSQRSGTLLKDILGQFAANQMKQDSCGQAGSLCGSMAAVMGQGLTATDGGPVKLPPPPPSPTAPGRSFSPEKELTSVCDGCTSSSFPKEER